jgi:hypothetical protein
MQIGYALAISGCTSAAFQLFLMPTLLRNFDVAKLYKFCMNIWPFTFIALPLLNMIARFGVDGNNGLVDTQITAVLWVGITITVALGRFGCLCYS